MAIKIRKYKQILPDGSVITTEIEANVLSKGISSAKRLLKIAPKKK